MAKIVQIHRMATAQASAYTGPVGEVIMDIGLDTLRIQDGATPGGFLLLAGANNLEEISNTATARENLGAAASANPEFTGNVGIGTTGGGWSGNAVFESTAGTGKWAVSAYNTADGKAIEARIDSTSGTLTEYRYTATIVGSITTNGTTTSYNTSSDARLKENITDAGDAGAVIDALRVRQWDWKSNGSHEAYGFIAQEEVLAAPFAVRPGDDNSETIEVQWSRDDSKLVPLLVKEIQSLRARLAALEAK